MKKIPLTPPILGLAVGTRAMLGAGMGLLASQKLRPAARRRLGTALLAFGALSTIPLFFAVKKSAGELPEPSGTL
jgi:hypothetical protein